MSRLTINMLKHNPFSEEPLKVTEYDLWKYYLELLQVKTDRFLGDPEIAVLAYVLAGQPNRSYFKRPYSKELEEYININNNYLHQIKRLLEEKNLIQKTEIRGDYLLHSRLASFQSDIKKRIKNGEQIEFTFKLEV